MSSWRKGPKRWVPFTGEFWLHKALTSRAGPGGTGFGPECRLHPLLSPTVSDPGSGVPEAAAGNGPEEENPGGEPGPSPVAPALPPCPESSPPVAPAPPGHVLTWGGPRGRAFLSWSAEAGGGLQALVQMP